MVKLMAHGKIDGKVRTRRNLVKVSSSNRQNKVEKGPKREINPWKVFAIILFAIVALPGVFFAKNYYEDHIRQRPISEQLQIHCKGIQRFLKEAEKDIKILDTDPLADIIKDHLGPIKDRIASLRTHARDYESMAKGIKIPGGPSHFISSSLQELNHIKYYQFPILDDKVHQIIVVYLSVKKKWKLPNVQKQWFGLMLDEKLEELDDHGIHFLPPEWLIGSEEEQEKGHEFFEMFTTLPGDAMETVERLSWIGETLQILSNLFRAKEVLDLKIATLARRHNFTFTEAEYELLVDLAEENNDTTNNFANETLTLNEEHYDVVALINEVIEENQQELEMTLPLISQVVHRISVLKENLSGQVDHLVIYTRLKEDVESDLDKLIQRLNALKG